MIYRLILQLNNMSKKIWYAPNGFEAYGDEEIEAVNRCLKEGWLVSILMHKSLVQGSYLDRLHFKSWPKDLALNIIL